ncbi:hypothetical protein [Neorhizobium alkalisoli]|uniref:Uncharacterized protein n=1 Tax=Neorhizobium alkalisoli TaxID=528178 RepID=A0A561QGN4_9HYPH|nr:hypothetical protein [Neorhizobium alkalisoli]TWF49525.1 hypothetical protein FHW37_108195 [Neorhizobium alkalisoli]
MFITRMALEMAFEWFAEDSEGLDPYDLAEGLACLVDDLMTRRGEEICYFQIKSGRVTDRLALKADFDNQQVLDRRQGFEASYFLVVTPRYAEGISRWLSEHDVECNIVEFPPVVGLTALLPLDGSIEELMAWLTGSQRRSVWIALHRNIIAKWILKRDYSIHELFSEIADETRYQSPAMLNDDIRLHAFFTLLESFEIYADDAEAHGVTLRSDVGGDDWFRIVPCNIEMLNQFDGWYDEHDEISTGQLMMWFEHYREEDEVL